jgi:hypothetical protein
MACVGGGIHARATAARRKPVFYYIITYPVLLGLKTGTKTGNEILYSIQTVPANWLC